MSSNGVHDTTFYIIVQNPVIANFTISPFNPAINETVIFINQSIGAASWVWDIDGNNFTTQTVSQTYTEGGTYSVTLVATSSTGCKDTLERSFTVIEDLLYFVPNAFTPDGDEFNQVFKPIFTSGFDPFDYKFQIFDRWGELIFESNNPELGWDGTYQGKMVQSDIYNWRIEFKLALNDERRIIHGHVNVLR